MIKGNIDKFKGTGLVGFLDVMGFSEQIKNQWTENDDNPLYKILKLRDFMPIPSKYNRDKIENDRKLTYICRVQMISDSIIVSYGFDDPSEYDSIFGVLSFFYTIYVIWRKTLEIGFTLRGSVDFGQIYWDEKDIVGPSLIRAYNLEKKDAKTSRIIVSSELNKYLKEFFNCQQLFANDILKKDIEDSLLRDLRKDIDGFLIINPHKLYSDEEDKIHVINLIKTLSEKTENHKEKYTPLLAVLDSDKYNLKKDNFGKY